MKNYVLFLFRSKLNLNIRGNNVERFIKRLKNNNIEILNITYLSKDEINIRIYKEDYDGVMNLKTIYEIDILDYYGTVRLKNNIFDNKFVIISILVAFVFLYFITNMVFSIEVVTNDSKMSETLKNELNEYGIKKYNFKKNYNEIQNIKKEILSKYKNELEWIEIENIGTKYIIRYEPRIINNIENNIPLRNIIASKDAVISDMSISNGQIVKNINSYVKKGDIIVSGYIDLNGSVKDTVGADGIVYGETWYEIKITYPYNYYENYETGKEKNVPVIKFLSTEIELFNFNKYKTKNVKDNILIKNNILPIWFSIQQQRETKVIDENYTEEELVKRAIEYSKKKLEEKLDKDEYVKSHKILEETKNTDSITLNIFFSVIENITEYQEIQEYQNEKEGEKVE